MAHLSAGELIRDVGHIDDPDHQQIELGQRLARKAMPGQTIAIDGHLVLPREGHFFDVPLAALRALNPNGIIVVKDDGATILRRRKNDQSRERENFPVNLLEDWQQREIALARNYAKHLGIDCREVSAQDTSQFIKTFKGFDCLS